MAVLVEDSIPTAMNGECCYHMYNAELLNPYVGIALSTTNGDTEHYVYSCGRRWMHCCIFTTTNILLWFNTQHLYVYMRPGIEILDNLVFIWAPAFMYVLSLSGQIWYVCMQINDICNRYIHSISILPKQHAEGNVINWITRKAPLLYAQHQ